MTPIIRPETTRDWAAIRHVNREAFGGEDEASLIDKLRDQSFVRISLVADLAQQVVGHIVFSDLPIMTERGTVWSLSLAPVSVLPSMQRQGIGSLLVQEGLKTAREQGHRIVIVLGHPEFYPRFGFSAELAQPLKSPFSGAAWMALELVDNALQGIQGTVVYPPPFGV